MWKLKAVLIPVTFDGGVQDPACKKAVSMITTPERDNFIFLMVLLGEIPQVRALEES